MASTTVAVRRKDVSKYYVQGRAVAEIASTMGVARNTIYSDLKQITKDWAAQYRRDAAELIQQEWQRLLLLEQECWDAFERSKEIRVEVQSRKGMSQGLRITDAEGKTLDNVDITQRKIISTMDGKPAHPEGNPVWIREIRAIIDQRVKLLGLSAADKRADRKIEADKAWKQDIIKLLEEGIDEEEVKELWPLTWMEIFDEAGIEYNVE